MVPTPSDPIRLLVVADPRPAAASGADVDVAALLAGLDPARFDSRRQPAPWAPAPAAADRPAAGGPAWSPEIVQLWTPPTYRWRRRVPHGPLAAVVERVDEARFDSTPRPWLTRLADRLTRPRVDRFVAASEAVRDALVAEGYPPHRTVLVRDGVEPLAAGTGPAWRHRHGLPADAPLIGLLLTPVAHALLPGALRTLVEQVRQRLPTARGLLLEQRDAAPSGYTGDRDVFVVSSPDPAEQAAGVAAMDVLVVLDPGLSLPRGLLLALAAGTPVVAATAPGSEEALSDGETGGLLTPPGRLDLAVEAVTRILTDPALRHSLSHSGRRRATDFAPAPRLRQFAEIYEDLAVDVRAARPQPR